MIAANLLERLVGFPTIVGQPNDALMAFVAEYLETHGATVHLLRGPEGDRFNLFATLGNPDVPGYVLSGHVDVVPAVEPDWQTDPFVLRRHEDRLIGRGACDMKGFDAAVLAAVPALAQLPLARPIHIAFSYDEEAGCRGVPHMLAKLPELCAAPLGCIVGEPSGLAPVLAHKGKAALRLVASGTPAHSSRPDLGVNAIHALIPALAQARALAQALVNGPQDARFTPAHSSLQVGVISGGQAINIVPDHAEARIEARAIDGVDPCEILAPLTEVEGVEAEWLASYPALALDADHPLATLAQKVSGNRPIGAVSFGTEAGLFQQAGIPAIICGPGDIARAHRPEEYLTIGELDAAQRMVEALGRAACAA